LSNTSKKEKIIENMNASPAIDVNVKIHIPRSPEPFDGRKHKFRCSCCGKGFTSQDKNFQKTNDVLFQSNNGYLPWCKECTDTYTAQTTALYCNNEELAMKDFCQRAGWNYDINALVASMETYSGHRSRSRISHYAAKKNINCDGRKTWIDTLKHNQTLKEYEVITTREQTKDGDIKVKGSSVDRWGLGFNEMDYKNLDDHYFMLKKNNPNADNNQEIFIKSLCNINMLMVRALQDGDSDKYVKLTEQYSKTFTKAGLKTIQEVDNSADECLGVTLATISQFTPEEYYKDKGLYKDFDKIGEYFTRFVKRPLKNLMTGSIDRDHEYYVKDKSGDLDD
jgi:hypothetical protein